MHTVFGHVSLNLVITMVLVTMVACNSEEIRPENYVNISDDTLYDLVDSRGVNITHRNYRAISDSCELELKVDGNLTSIAKNGTVWAAEVIVNSGSDVSIALMWKCNPTGSREIAIASLEEQITVSGENMTLSLSSADFNDSPYDEDNDGQSNLVEFFGPRNPYYNEDRYDEIWGTVPYIASPPVIDGRPGDWPANLDPIGKIDNLMFTEDGNPQLNDGESGSEVYAVHDGSYLYLLVYSDDQTVLRDSSLYHDDDNLNLYLDGGYSHTSSYNSDGANNDYNIKIPMLRNSSAADNYSAFTLGINSADIDSQVFDFDTGPGRGIASANYTSFMDVYEFRITLDSIDANPGNRFGLEIQIDDDDNGGGRDAKWGLFHPSGNNANIYDGDQTNDYAYQSPTYLKPIYIEY